ncbi:hypothetical protein [Streptomyces sp. A5-4]|uniref:hypothetical protein n=1 Tax=Streptomyces sp. A5-4 TaxID=3384771 RepID=UPI003DA9B44A
MRPPHQAPQAEQSHTPIYDALYSEYLRSFRALPGDRHGEEDLGFTAFGPRTHQGPGTGSGQHSGYGNHSGQGMNSGYTSSWHSNSNGRQHTGNHVPAALPPAPRRGF